MTIRFRLLLNLAILIGLFAFFGGSFFYAKHEYNDLQHELNTIRLELKTWLLVDREASYLTKEILESLYFHAQDNSPNGPLGEALASEQVEQAMQYNEKTILGEIREAADPEDQAEKTRELERIRTIHGLYSALKRDISATFGLYRQGRVEAARKYFFTRVEQPEHDNELHRLAVAAVTKEDQEAEEIAESLENLNHRLASSFSLMLALSFLLALLAARSINNSIMSAIRAATDGLMRGITDVGAGKLDSAVRLDEKNELSIVGNAFNQMISDLRDARHTIGEQQQKFIVSSKMSALGEMAAGIAHEINNPLAVIKSLTGQLQEVVDDEPLDKSLLKEMAAQAEKTTDRIAKIVQGMRTFSRDGSKDPFQKVPVRSLVEETLALCEEKIKRYGTSLIIEPFSPDLCVEGRGTELSQVLLNLLNNAQDGVRDKPEKWIKVSVLDRAGSVEIHVTDSGKGIPAAVQKKLFQPFFTTKEVGKGTGLGLSISIGIVQNHHGELKLDAACPNTRFIIRLPKAAVAVKAAA